MGKIIQFNNGNFNVVEFAADTQLAALRIQDQVLTNIAQGYRNHEMAAPLLFPKIVVEQESGRFPAFGKEAWQIFTTTRALRGQVNRMEVAYSNVTLTLAESALGFAIDKRELKAFNGDDTMLKTVRQQKVEDALDLYRENSIAFTLVTAGNYSNTANCTTKAYLASDDFVKDVETAKWTIAKTVGKMPNLMIISPAAWQVVRNSPSVIERLKYGAAPGAFPQGNVSAQAMGQLLELDNVFVAKAVKSTDAGSVSFVWDQVQSGNVILAYVGNGYGVPSFGYSYSLSGYPIVDSYYEVQRHSDVYESHRIYADAITLAGAGYLMYNVAA